MSAKLLQKFFRAKKVKADNAGHIDWVARRDTWIAALNGLYNLIREWLAPSIEDGSVVVTTSVKTITEDHIGSYKVDELRLAVGNEVVVVFSPKGTLVVGASGRVDIIGDQDIRTLILQPGERWSIVATMTPTLKLIPLDADNFLEALKVVMK